MTVSAIATERLLRLADVLDALPEEQFNITSWHDVAELPHGMTLRITTLRKRPSTGAG